MRKRAFDAGIKYTNLRQRKEFKRIYHKEFFESQLVANLFNDPIQKKKKKNIENKIIL